MPLANVYLYKFRQLTVRIINNFMPRMMFRQTEWQTQHIQIHANC